MVRSRLVCRVRLSSFTSQITLGSLAFPKAYALACNRMIQVEADGFHNDGKGAGCSPYYFSNQSMPLFAALTRAHSLVAT